MTKKELAKIISKETSLTYEQALNVINSILKVTKKSLKQKGVQKISALGTFTVRKKASRLVNIYSKKITTVTTHFIPSKELNEALGGGGGTDFTGPRNK